MISTTKRGIAFLSTFPPRACGIATYTTDLMKAISSKFEDSYDLIPIPIVETRDQANYDQAPLGILEIGDPVSFDTLFENIQHYKNIDIVCIEHEFGLFAGQEARFRSLVSALYATQITIVVTFHTVLPSPDSALRDQVSAIAEYCSQIVVMTQNSADILINAYKIAPNKITVIAHGTHLAPATNKQATLERYNLLGKKVLSTFGLLGPSKSIETTLYALPAIIKQNPNVLFLILGQTHPTLLQWEGETYRNQLQEIINQQGIADHVRFVNEFLSIESLLAYLSITDVYLFTSKDPLQAVSGTFSYALSSGCPIVSTPIPHVREVLKADMGTMIDFGASDQLADAVNQILDDTPRLEKIRHVNLQKMVKTSWQNVAIAHVNLFELLIDEKRDMLYSIPPLNLDHMFRMSTERAFVQFADISMPDLTSGYALDDNARALIAMLHHYKLYESQEDLGLIKKYLDFIAYCMQDDGTFLNYVDIDGNFTLQNEQENLEDANGRAVWALGEVVGLANLLPERIVKPAIELLERASKHALVYYSTRSMAFTIKGLSFMKGNNYKAIIEVLADRLVAMFEYESTADWQWYESYMTYGNSVIPEALLAAYESAGDKRYRDIAYQSFDFLLSRIIVDDEIHVISNKGWAQRDQPRAQPKGGEQPIDVAYTIIALDRFYRHTKDENYKNTIRTAFEWFLGRNHIQQIVYNPVTGGCFDGLEERTVNINQGAESTISYLLARLKMEAYLPETVS
ncbi:glycosyltransferase [Sphingobacterium sp. ML3W]|uniref:glycosyltransferase n=1 Tax=Sphingobacterium sp. ML3W TaxID=1538644 RepID=UPI00249B1F74|nr:glycosyltransferase [Sphingobacterium sp. ML3W]WFA80783.1 glycosyltransferase [Sphingobacterium sp. ML3W]